MASEDELGRSIGLQPRDLAVLRDVLLFKGLETDVLQAMLRGARVSCQPRGARLFSQGDPADRFFVVLDGWVKLTRQSRDGHESVIGVFGRSESFAEAAAFESGNFPVDAGVVEEARLLAITSRPFLALLRERPEIAFNMMAAMSRHLRNLVQQIEQLSTRTALERLARFLVSLADQPGTPARVRLPLDKALIAARLGMQPETFSRSLARLRQVGVVEEAGELVIPDLGALLRIAEGETSAPRRH